MATITTNEIIGPGGETICSCCGAKLVEYRFTFNKGLAIFLAKLFEKNGECKTDDLGLRYSQRTNSHKLRYWGLAEQCKHDEARLKRGWWQITDKGRRFVLGDINIQETAVTKRNEVLGFEGEMITFKQVSAGYEFYADFVEQIRRQITTTDDGQKRLWG